jgi:cell division protein FtsN
VAARRRQGGSRTGTLLVLVGIAGVLGVTFVAGVWTGRHWPLLTGAPAKPAPAEASRGTAERPRQAEPLPALTFYQELTAPLTAPPPPPKPARPARPPESRREAEAAPEPAPPPGVVFTVQVGAYNQRGPAETLRASLVAAGHEARVAEARTPGGVRYRVQVGRFPTRDAAKEAAARLGAEQTLPAFVTTR